MYKNEITKLKSLVSEDTWRLLKESNAIIAGGALTSLFTNQEVNDIDVYFRNEDDFLYFITGAYGKNEEADIDSYTLRCNNLTSRSVLFQDTHTQQDVQAIVYKYFPTIEDVFKDYDFTINMAALEFKHEKENDEHLVLHPEFLKHNSQRYLQFNTGTAYPLISALRVQKYTERGYKISKSQMLRVLLVIAEKNIDSWEKLKDEIGGMYGLNMDEVFPENKEFSLEEALNTLDEVVSDKKFASYNKTVFINDIFSSVFKLNFNSEALEGKYFYIGKDIVSQKDEVGSKAVVSDYAIFNAADILNYLEYTQYIVEVEGVVHKPSNLNMYSSKFNASNATVKNTYTVKEFLDLYKEVK